MQPVKIGSAVKYVRTHPEHETHDAILIRYDAETDTGKVPNATLVIAFPKGYHNFSDANWPDAFEEVHSVPYQPEGDFYHGWSEVVEASSALLKDSYSHLKQSEEESFAKDQLIADLEAKVKDLTAQVAAYDKGPDPAVPAQPEADVATQLDQAGAPPQDAQGAAEPPAN